MRRRRIGSTAESAQVEPVLELIPSSEWTREGELEGWDRETGDRTVSEILADIAATRMIWFTSDEDGGIALEVEPGFEVPGDILERLRDNREGIVRWWNDKGTRYTWWLERDTSHKPLEATIEG